MKRQAPSPEQTSVQVSGEGVKVSLPSSQTASIGAVIGDLLSPLIQGTGIVSDYLFFFRQKTALKALRRVHEIAKEQGVTLKPVATKFLVPWIEAVSMEDDHSLIEMWARLLVGTSNDPRTARVIFVDALKRLRTQDAKRLEAIWSTFSPSEIFSLTTDDRDLALSETDLVVQIRDLANALKGVHYLANAKMGKSVRVEKRTNRFSENVEEKINGYINYLLEAGINPIRVELTIELPSINRIFGSEQDILEHADSLAALAAVSCVQFAKRDFSDSFENYHAKGTIHYFGLTMFGFDLMQVCHSLPIFQPKRTRPATSFVSLMRF